MAIYVLDSNFFIEAHRSTYPLDIATGFWNRIHELATAGTIISIDKVKDELYDKNDELEAWCREFLPEDFFRSTTSVINEYRMISEWTVSRRDHYLANAINDFLEADEADAFLIAFALADTQNRIIVTQEVSDPNRRNRIKIPEPCDHFHVKYVNTIEMFRQLGVTF